MGCMNLSVPNICHWVGSGSCMTTLTEGREKLFTHYPIQGRANRWGTDTELVCVSIVDINRGWLDSA
jgi:hypothetical protein